MKATLALTLLLLSVGGLRAQVRLTGTLNKAILEEESQHNLPAAVADYQQVVAAFDEERKTAATALFRLAECQRKLHHDDQAKAAYERIVREFADQGGVVEQSRTILAATYKVTATPAAPGRVVIDPQVENARQRYRNALQSSLALAESDQARIENLVRQGVVPEPVANDAKERADDYLVKPFSTEELLARVRALLRRRTAARRSVGALGRGDVRVDLVKLTAARGSESLRLTAKEFAVLRLLAEAGGEPVTRQRFLDLVWGYAAFPTTRTVDNHIASLRAKLEADADSKPWIETVHGVGYRLSTAVILQNRDSSTETIPHNAKEGDSQ